MPASEGSRRVEVAGLGDLLGIHHHHGDVIIHPAGHRVAPEIELHVEGKRYPRRLDDHPIRIHALVEHLQGVDQLIGQAAADAAAFEFDVGLPRATQQRLIDPQLPELVRDHGNPQPRGLTVRQEPADEGGFPGPEEARHHQRGNLPGHAGAAPRTGRRLAGLPRLPG